MDTCSLTHTHTQTHTQVAESVLSAHAHTRTQTHAHRHTHTHTHTHPRPSGPALTCRGERGIQHWSPLTTWSSGSAPHRPRITELLPVTQCPHVCSHEDPHNPNPQWAAAEGRNEPGTGARTGEGRSFLTLPGLRFPAPSG